MNSADDILMFWSTQAEHNQNVISFLERCLEIDLKVRPSKVRLICTEVPFFGQRMSAQGKVKVIKESLCQLM